MEIIYNSRASVKSALNRGNNWDMISQTSHQIE